MLILDLLERLFWQFFAPTWEKPPPEHLWQAWAEYRLEQLEWRVLWMFRFALLVLITDLILHLVV